MMIIPVLDLMNGHVVHAIRGERDLYQPVASTLCSASDPYSVIDGFLKLYPFPVIYMADLNAISGNDDHLNLVKDIVTRYPDIKFWIDAGHEQLDKQRNITPVIGTETSVSFSQIMSLIEQHPEAVLSVDFDTDGKLMHPDLLGTGDCWPDRVIAMMLSRVGTAKGIDKEGLDLIRKQAGDRQIYVGGGVANAREIKALTDENIAGALVATALHNGSISANDVKRVMES